MDITITADVLKKIGLRVVQLIRARTLAGVDIHDKAFHGYSVKPFVMPAGAVQKKAFNALKKKEGLTMFTAKSGAEWVLIKDGYKALRGAMGKEVATVNLSLTGAMLRGMTVISVSQEAKEVRVGFADIDAAEKAYYHNVAGAGKGKTKREFLGLSPKDLQDPTLVRLVSDGAQIIT